MCCMFIVFFFKQKTAYEMRISDWSSDVCSSDLQHSGGHGCAGHEVWFHWPGMRRPTGRRLYSRHTFLRDRLQDGATEWRTIDSTLPDPRHARCTTHHEHLPGRIAVSSGFRIDPRTPSINTSPAFLRARKRVKQGKRVSVQ